MSASSQPAARHPIARLAPAWKLGVWAAGIAVLGLVIQSGAWLLGLEFDILSQSGGGRGVLTGLALGGLLVLMALERRPAADYGLAVDGRWARHLAGGFLIGVATYAGYYAVTVFTGALAPREGLTAYRWFSAGLTALAAFGVAFVQEIIFRGYLLSVFRERHGRVVAVVVTAFLFAVLHRVEDPLSMLTPAYLPLLAGMGAIGVLLGVLRLHYGNILFPASLLSGWIYVEMVVRKTKFLRTVADPAWAEWLCPDADPRRGLVMWTALGAAALVYAVRLRRTPAGALVDRPRSAAPSVATSFKRVFPLATMSMLAPLDLWLARLWHARFAVGLKYLPRLLAVLLFSALNTLLSLPERFVLPLLLRRRGVPDPVFIVGAHRSGTTHLQNLLALDARFVTPRTYQVMNPIGFLFSGWLLTPLLGAFSPWKRPMDSMRFHIFSPNEEEFALCNTTRLSPHWGMAFPRQGRYYDRSIDAGGFSRRERRAWMRHYLLFLRKLTLWSGKRPLLKNPYNTARVALLRDMFPAAKFIHIYRHPYAVYRSNRHLEQEGHCLVQLQDPEPDNSYTARYAANYRAMEEAFYRDAEQLSSDQVAEIRFESLERDAVGTIRRAYEQLGWEFNTAFRDALETYLAGVAGYQKNRFQPLDAATHRRIDPALRPLLERWGYDVEQGDAIEWAQHSPSHAHAVHPPHQILAGASAQRD